MARFARRAVPIVAICAALLSPAAAGATNFAFDGRFEHGLPDSEVHFELRGGDEIHNWTWRHIPVECREGSDFNSGHYTFVLHVHNHHFHATGILNRAEGSRTTLDGTLTDHNRKASGTVSMSGSEDGPPPKTHCHGFEHWTATGIRLGDLTYRTETVQAPLNSATVGAAACPEDHGNLAGGGVFPHAIAESRISLGETLPEFGGLDPDSWLGGIGNASEADAAPFDITAICSNGPLRHVTGSRLLGPRSRATQTVLCPSGTHVVGGGVGNNFAETDRLVQIQSSRPTDSHDPGLTPDDGWQGTVINDATGHSALVTVTAICSEEDSFAYESATRQIPSNALVEVRARCPADTHVSGGGVEVAGLPTRITATAPFDGGDGGNAPDDGWTGRGDNSSTIAPHDITAFAICER
ncbi:MAG: hypothetical protein U0R71_17460 [Solirubrobacterales bacterium]